ncbi:MAG: hypothetical protein E7018_00395 [Alphaproteobacteria bacterium]|nr:hypothetical protein [Alphaproteobacteria bacterium]
MFASVRYLVSLLTISAFWLVYVTAPVQAYSHRLSPRTFYQMYNLASQGNKTALSNAIARGLNINAINDYGNTALCVAVKMRDVRAYNTLRSVGADPRPPCSHSIPNFDSFVNSPEVIKSATYIPRGYTNRSPRPSFNWGGTLLTAGIVATGVGVAFGMGGGGGGGSDSSSSSENTPIPGPNEPVCDPTGCLPNQICKQENSCGGCDICVDKCQDNPCAEGCYENIQCNSSCASYNECGGCIKCNDFENNSPLKEDITYYYITNNIDGSIEGNVTAKDGNGNGLLTNYGSITGNIEADNVENGTDASIVGNVLVDNGLGTGILNNSGLIDGDVTGNKINNSSTITGQVTGSNITNNSGATIGNGVTGKDGTASEILDNSGAITGNVSISQITNNLGGSIDGNVVGTTVTNNASITGQVTGSNITNNSGATIGNGVTGKDGTASEILDNSGSISGDVSIAQITNNLGGTIEGNITSTGKLSNLGTITGDTINGSDIENSASITGDVSGSIITNSAGSIDGNVVGTTVTNNASITGQVTGSNITNNSGATIGNGVTGKDGTASEILDNSGSISGDVSIAQITNNTDATINGNITATGKITNQGTITGDTINGSDIENSASITGDVSGSIITNSAGSIDGNVVGTTVTNNASITGQVTGSNITNNSGATIGNGITGKDGTASEILDNSGAITGNVSISQITNNLGGSIDGNITSTGKLSNSGTITGDVTATDGSGNGEVENSGTIKGIVTGDSIKNLAGLIDGNIVGTTVTNNDSITGQVTGSNITNNSGATIGNGVTGKDGTASEILDNSGAITGNVSISQITNNLGGTIEGNITSTGKLSNLGTITGDVTATDGSGNGEVENSGTIKGSVNSINIKNNAGIIEGNISGSFIENSTGASIFGNVNAVGEDGSGMLKNYGSITTDYLELDQMDNQGSISALGTNTFMLKIHNQNNTTLDLSKVTFNKKKNIDIATDLSKTINLGDLIFENSDNTPQYGITFHNIENSLDTTSDEISILNINSLDISNITSNGATYFEGGILVDGANLQVNLNNDLTINSDIVPISGVKINADANVTFNNKGILTVQHSASAGAPFTTEPIHGIYAIGNATINNEGTISVFSNNNKNTYGIRLENGATGENKNTITISGGSSYTYGVYAENSSFVNNGTIIVEGSEKVYGIYANVTHNKNYVIRNENSIHVTSSQSGDAVGIYGNGNVMLMNFGTIHVSEGGQECQAENGAQCAGSEEPAAAAINETQSASTSPMAFSLRGGARMINQGTISAEEELDFDAMTQGEGTVYAARGSRFMANSIRGSLTAGADITIGSNQDQYTSTNAISAAQSNINLTSGSAMFTASLQQNGTDYDIVMNRSAFSDLLTNNSLANLLEHNYQSDKRIDFFDTLKTASTPKALNSALNKYTGSNFIPLIGWQNIQRINHISNTMSDLALSNQNLKEERIIAAADNYYINQDSTSSWSGYEDYINGINGLFDKAVTPQYRFGISFGFYNARTDFDTNESRRDSIVLASLPNRIDYDNWGALFMPYIGYSNSEYKRYVDSQKFEPNFDVWYQGINNKLFVKTHTLGMELKPTIEFNVHNIHQNKITEENNVSIASENILSMQTGVGFEINKDIDFGQSGKLGLHGGLMFYQELGSDVEDTYSAQIYGMDGRFNIPGYNQDDNRTELRLKADYQIENWNIYAEFDKSFATNDNTTYNIGVKLAF